MISLGASATLRYQCKKFVGDGKWMFTYAEAETLLAKLHSADIEVQRGAFRGRLKHLKRLGIPLGSNPGRGQKTTYAKEHLYQWAFCLELEEFGIDPTVIVELVNRHWGSYIFSAYKLALRKAPEKTYFEFQPQLMSASWLPNGGIPWFGRAPESELLDIVSATKPGKPARFCIFDITRAVLAIEVAAEGQI